MSHPDLRTNPDASHMCAKIKFHTYNDSVYRDKCHNLYYIMRMSYKITDNKISRTKITISTTRLTRRQCLDLYTESLYMWIFTWCIYETHSGSPLNTSVTSCLVVSTGLKSRLQILIECTLRKCRDTH
jgi:hypothetical protein